MAETTAISWADHTFNPWEGCTRISPACDNCYAADRAHRFGNDRLWAGELRRTSPANWRKPLTWNRAAEAAGVKARVFCASLADVFDNQATPEWREDLWRLVEATPNLIWMLLTKRPQNVTLKMLPASAKLASELPRNVELGVTVENVAERDRRLLIALRIGHLIGWRVFVSCEPLLEAVDLTRVVIGDERFAIKGRLNALTGGVAEAPMGEQADGQAIIGLQDYARLSLVIAGGESGPKARPSHPDWFRSLRDQCADADVPFHFKQWGEWTEGPAGITAMQGGLLPGSRPQAVAWPDGTISDSGFSYQHGGAGVWLRRVGAARAGRLLDGVEHLAMPVVA